MKKGISQETLKLIACVTMLIDHVGAVFFPRIALFRILGRMAFPIYCFLLVEGANHTKNPPKYGQRLLLGILLAELPFDLLFRGGIVWTSQSVMVTLFVGFLMILAARRWGILAPFLLGYLGMIVLRGDYRGYGLFLIAVFYDASGKEHERWLQCAGLAMAALLHNGADVPILGFGVPLQMFSLLAMIPIALYSGQKRTNSKWIQWGFYLFYPVHMLALYLLTLL